MFNLAHQPRWEQQWLGGMQGNLSFMPEDSKISNL
jgi:hypothetical protein